MPPILALFLTIGLIVFLFQRDFRERPNVTSALWLPTLWLLIIASRSIAEWLNFFGLPVGENSLEEGSPVDACVYFILIASGFLILRRRKVSLMEIIQHNRLLFIFFAYCFFATLWSDYTFVSIKRWVKILGHPIMTLIVFTEPDPKKALTTMMKRCAYVIIPVSIVFIKYFPQWGRGFDSWGGLPVNTGITTNKNILGLDCLILGFFFFWHLLNIWPREKDRHRRNELILCLGFLIAIGWLLHMAHSSTSLFSLMVAIGVVLFLGLPFVNKRRIGFYTIAFILFCVLVQMTFHISDQVIALLGRDPTLTDRTLVWKAVLQTDINPIIGTGFESFWIGERQERISSLFSFEINQAHNGYLETYINLGLVGLFLMLALIVSAFLKGSRSLLYNFEFGRFRMGFLAAFVLYNWTEAAFKALHPMWFVFYIIAIDYPKAAFVSDEPTDEEARNVADRASGVLSANGSAL
jgi:exopolysaccharide production protein ExoQ